jgi:hypothetical protein
MRAVLMQVGAMESAARCWLIADRLVTCAFSVFHFEFRDMSSAVGKRFSSDKIPGHEYSKSTTPT